MKVTFQVIVGLSLISTALTLVYMTQLMSWGAAPTHIQGVPRGYDLSSLEIPSELKWGHAVSVLSRSLSSFQNEELTIPLFLYAAMWHLAEDVVGPTLSPEDRFPRLAFAMLQKLTNTSHAQCYREIANRDPFPKEDSLNGKDDMNNQDIKGNDGLRKRKKEKVARRIDLHEETDCLSAARFTLSHVFKASYPSFYHPASRLSLGEIASRCSSRPWVFWGHVNTPIMCKDLLRRVVFSVDRHLSELSIPHWLARSTAFSASHLGDVAPWASHVTMGYIAERDGKRTDLNLRGMSVAEVGLEPNLKIGLVHVPSSKLTCHSVVRLRPAGSNAVPSAMFIDLVPYVHRGKRLVNLCDKTELEEEDVLPTTPCSFGPHRVECMKLQHRAFSPIPKHDHPGSPSSTKTSLSDLNGRVEEGRGGGGGRGEEEREREREGEGERVEPMYDVSSWGEPCDSLTCIIGAGRKKWNDKSHFSGHSQFWEALHQPFSTPSSSASSPSSSSTFPTSLHGAATLSRLRDVYRDRWHVAVRSRLTFSHRSSFVATMEKACPHPSSQLSTPEAAARFKEVYSHRWLENAWRCMRWAQDEPKHCSWLKSDKESNSFLQWSVHAGKMCSHEIPFKETRLPRRFRTCAVVGKGERLVLEPYADDIDSYEGVFRTDFDDLDEVKHIRGRRTTALVVNEWLREQKTYFRLAGGLKPYTRQDRDLALIVSTPSGKTSPLPQMQQVTAWARPTADMCFMGGPLLRHGYTRSRCRAPQAVDTTNSDEGGGRGGGAPPTRGSDDDKEADVPSTFYWGLTLAASLCDRVDVYGGGSVGHVPYESPLTPPNSTASLSATALKRALRGRPSARSHSFFWEEAVVREGFDRFSFVSLSPSESL